MLGALAFLVLAGVIVSSFATVVPPDAVTHTAIQESFFRIQMHIARHRRFPASLDELPKRKGHANRTTDGWHRPLIYRIEEDNFVTLLSLGKDGQPGGTGENADIQTTYRTKNADGSWCVGGVGTLPP
jgi:hypothetical protein